MRNARAELLIFSPLIQLFNRSLFGVVATGCREKACSHMDVLSGRAPYNERWKSAAGTLRAEFPVKRLLVLFARDDKE